MNLTNIQKFLAELTLSDAQLQNFGWVVGGLFLFIALLFEVSHSHDEFKNVFVILGAVLVIFGTVAPKALSYPYRFWMLLGFVFGLVIDSQQYVISMI